MAMVRVELVVVVGVVCSPFVMVLQLFLLLVVVLLLLLLFFVLVVDDGVVIAGVLLRCCCCSCSDYCYVFVSRLCSWGPSCYW